MEIVKKNLKSFLLTLVAVLIIYLIDRMSKIYIINLAEVQNVDFYITEYLNFYLVWNQGISFGLFSTEHNFTYKIITIIHLNSNSNYNHNHNHNHNHLY